ncbi:uncharacterized protein LOC129609187 [Condylostylus longicornis]|uniref:uncharacterized protein LOC129609187 n=1 Tax=Condylostylus longicornis TaxID=2530218 RepID=UPI00244DDB8A|nr:uncharacterized protein LOC129609187 [Condylostylus longicornis]
MADTVIVLSSDEEDSEHNASKWERGISMNVPLQVLRRKVIEILFQYNSGGFGIFPYDKLREFVGEFQKVLKLLDKSSIPKMKFFWKTIIQWVMAIKMAFTGNVGDLKEDLKLNILLTDIMAEYVMFKCNITLKLSNDKAETENSANCIIRILSMVFSRNISFIQMTMLKVAIIPKYHDILNPIFLKCMSDEEHPVNEDLISYLRVIFYFRQWKNLCSTKEEKEKINILAVGLSKKALRSSNTIDLVSDTVLPKYVPPVNELNNSFPSISDLIKFAMDKGNFGTRILLINKSLNLKEAIERYFKQLERYISWVDFQAYSLDDKDYDYTSSNLNTILLTINIKVPFLKFCWI